MAEERSIVEILDVDEMSKAREEFWQVEVLSWKRFYASRLIEFRKLSRNDVIKPIDATSDEIQAELKRIDEREIFPGVRGKELVDAWESNCRLAWHSVTRYTGHWFAVGPQP